MFSILGHRQAAIIGREIADVVGKKGAEFSPAQFIVNVAPKVAELAGNNADVTIRHAGHELLQSRKSTILDFIA